MEFLVVLVLSLLLPPQSAARDRVQDDAQVVSAVLTQTVRREVDKLLARPDGWRGSPVVILLDRTIPICPDKSGPWEECLDSATLQGIRQPWWTEAASLAFTQRNTQSTSAPVVKLPNVQYARYEAAPGRRPNDLYPTAAGWASVSLPAYLEPGRAVVYVNFACGALCCREWFIVLERTPGGWRVGQEVQVVIC